MGDIMRPVPFEALLTRIFDEYQTIARYLVFLNSNFTRRQARIDSPCSARVVQPRWTCRRTAYQLAQNIITSWLTGGRFIELKTVQILDRLELEKPCIDAEDECFNTEWSTEFTLKRRLMST